eukprot:COSAG04_NODE_31434_length_257_cov_0.455696_1_plen_41_part_10
MPAAIAGTDSRPRAYVLEQASEGLQADKEVVLAAVAQNGRA